MKKHLIIGNPINHSLSPKLHNYWFKKNKIDAIYEKKIAEDNTIKDVINDIKNDKIEKYYTHCHKIGVVPKYLNKLQNKLYGIECNYEDLNGIDFKKGCYVGQENTARIKLKNKLSKRLLPIEIIDGSLSDEEKIYNNEVEIGKVLINGEYPFALIKFLDKNFNKDQIFKSKNCSFRICVPQWLKI